MPLLICEECGEAAEPVTGRVVYPHRPDLARKRFMRCPVCGDYVGCHESTGEPFGTLAGPALRQARRAAHRQFDSIWQSGRMSRREAYEWLAEQMGLAEEDCHIGQFTERECRTVIDAVCAYEFA